jgi:3-hydroxyacyl-CoA dehydrogenase
MKGTVLVGTLSNPPVNGLSRALRKALCELMQHADSDPAVEAVVILGAGRCFSAGADIKELGTPAATAQPGLSSHVHPAIESCAKPVVAALHGVAMGGGLETALACHFRVAHPDTRIATPEINLGLIPLSGTQRLPRLLGLEIALQMIVGTREFKAAEVPGLCDLLTTGGTSLEEEAVNFATQVARAKPAQHLIRNRSVADPDPELIIERWKSAQVHTNTNRPVGSTEAIAGALEAVAAAFRQPTFDAGLACARAIYDRLNQSPAVLAARTEFLSRRRTSN